jgi:iron(III) transport system substrate-binding protein
LFDAMKINTLAPSLLLIAAVASQVAVAQEKQLNLYSARHYQTDEALYANFTRQTGIQINRIEAKEDELLERIRNEGAKSPADVFLTVDAARLAKADELGCSLQSSQKYWKIAFRPTCAAPTGLRFPPGPG